MASAGDNFSLSEDYLSLKAKETGFFELVRLMLFPNITSMNSFIGRPQEEHMDFSSRWIIFVSLLAQKILISCQKPMRFVGVVVDTCLNISSANGGCFGLLVNILKGEVVVPKKSSQSFTSIVGHIDPRVELDKKIKRGSSKYNASLALMAAKLSYENRNFVQKAAKDHLKMEFLGFYDCWNDCEGRKATNGIMFRDTSVDPNLVVVGFRGTSPFDPDDWLTDIDLSWYSVKGAGNVHEGFMRELGQQKGSGWPKEVESGQCYAYYTIRKRLREILLQENETAKFVLAGHSLGGALAILFAAVLMFHEDEELLERLEGVYTFGQPRVGDDSFGKYMTEMLKVYNVKYHRYVYCNDIVPRLPYDDGGRFFKHFGTCHYFGSCYNGKIMSEEPNKNYFSLISFLPSRLNAAWEFGRSLILPYRAGPEYREVWLSSFARLSALVFPGIASHSPTDYNNVTRLGTIS